MVAAILVSLTVLTWGWQGGIARSRHLEGTGEPWDRVKNVYPMSDKSPTVPTLPKDLLERVVHANPFSPKRRFVAPQPDAGGDSSHQGPSPSATPAFLYKGRVTLGTRQRAILQETTSGKTYFLEVGQAVAGFKVLDIAENRVVLSDSQTGKELSVSLSSETDR